MFAFLITPKQLDAIYKKETAKEEAERQKDISDKIADKVKSDPNGMRMSTQADIARLQHQANPKDIYTPLQTIQKCLMKNSESLSANLAALDALFDMVGDIQVINKDLAKKIDSNPLISQIKIISDNLGGLKCEPFELGRTFNLLNGLSDKFWSYDEKFKPSFEGELPKFSLQDVKMPQISQSLEEYYQTCILCPVLWKTIDEALSDQPMSINRNLQIISSIFRELKEYRDEKKGGLLTPNHIAYNTDPATNILLDGLKRAIANLDDSRAFVPAAGSIDYDLSDLRNAIEAFTQEPLDLQGVKGFSKNNANYHSLTEYVFFKLEAPGNDPSAFYLLKISEPIKRATTPKMDDNIVERSQTY